jgi:hypothetical protein
VLTPDELDAAWSLINKLVTSNKPSPEERIALLKAAAIVDDISFKMEREHAIVQR